MVQRVARRTEKNREKERKKKREVRLDSTRLDSPGLAPTLLGLDFACLCSRYRHEAKEKTEAEEVEEKEEQEKKEKTYFARGYRSKQEKSRPKERGGSARRREIECMCVRVKWEVSSSSGERGAKKKKKGTDIPERR